MVNVKSIIDQQRIERNSRWANLFHQQKIAIGSALDDNRLFFSESFNHAVISAEASSLHSQKLLDEDTHSPLA